MYIDIAWIRKDDHLTHIGDGVEGLIGWTAEEIKRLPLGSLVTPSSFEYIQHNYFRGPPDSIMVRSFPMWLCHKDGHEVCCRFSAVCRYAADGKLVEAWGCIQCHKRQCALNDLLAWWPQANEWDLETVARTAEMYAAL